MVRTNPSSNVDLRAHAPAPLVRTNLEFERFDRVGSQNSSDPAFDLLLTAVSNAGFFSTLLPARCVSKIVSNFEH